MAPPLPREHGTIPNHFHFIWFGESLPDFARIAILSALQQNPGSAATIWHDADFTRHANMRQLEERGARFKRITPTHLFAELAEVSPELPTEKLKEIYLALTKPAARANVIRMVVLYLFGGIYLDTDTLTVKSFAPLRELGAFCGEEPTLWPAGTALLDPKALVLGEIRRACSFWPGGFRIHRRLLHQYTMAANNAVFGARRLHPFVGAMLTRAANLPESQRGRQYRLGTHLLQETLREFNTSSCPAENRMCVLSSTHFYPLGPEISRHYFHRYRNPRAISHELLSDETFAIHWYASVSDLKSKDAHFIRKTAEHTVYSALCRPHVSDPEPVTARMPAISLA